jgi:putative sigma-54 modulation protein
MALKVDILAKNMEVTDRIQEYVTKKVSKLDRFLADVEEARVDLNYVKSVRSAADRYGAQITLRGKGFILRAEEHSSDLFAALDAMVDKIQRQIERYKGKRAHGRGDGTSAAEVAPDVTPVEETIGPVIARRKAFTLVPMDEVEALEQMALLGHENFFIFYNVNTNSVNVLYKRNDGSFGLIEPQLG